MGKRFIQFACFVMLIACILTAGAFAEEYTDVPPEEIIIDVLLRG